MTACSQDSGIIFGQRKDRNRKTGSKIMNIRKLTAFVLIASMVSLILPGCKKDTESTDASLVPTTVETTPTTTETTAETTSYKLYTAEVADCKFHIFFRWIILTLSFHRLDNGFNIINLVFCKPIFGVKICISPWFRKILFWQKNIRRSSNHYRRARLHNEKTCYVSCENKGKRVCD